MVEARMGEDGGVDFRRIDAGDEQPRVEQRLRGAAGRATELDHMLELTGGRREVPVIVEAGRVTIGFGGT